MYGPKVFPQCSNLIHLKPGERHGCGADREFVPPLDPFSLSFLPFGLYILYSLFTDLKISSFSMGIWIIAILTGILMGWIFVKRLNVKIDKKRWLIEMPGTWSTLLLILIIFANKYYFGHRLAINSFFSEDVVFQFWMLGISGLCAGLFMGKFLCFLHRFRTAEHVALEKS